MRFFQANLFRTHAACLALLLAGLMAATAQADVRILLDVSRSMALNDPTNARSEAIQLLIGALPEGEPAGIWTFGQAVNLLVPHEPVDDAWRDQARIAISGQGAPALRTNIGRVLEEADYDFNFSSFDRSVHIILVTDGQVDISANSSVNRVERTRILNHVVTDYRVAGARIHTVAISDDADQALLQQLSEQTGGLYQQVDDVANLSQNLFALLSEVSPANQVILAEAEQSFRIDGSVREATILLDGPTQVLSLVSPTGITTSVDQPGSQRWRDMAGMTQVSVTAPEPGVWQVLGELAPGAAIHVLSDLTLRWRSPSSSNVPADTSLTVVAELVGPDGQVHDQDLTGFVTASLNVDGQPVQTSVMADRIVARLPAGNLDETLLLELTVDGGTFNRLLTRQLNFVAPYRTEVLMTENAYEWRVYPNRYISNVESANLTAMYPSGDETASEIFESTDSGYWVWQLPYDADAGLYVATLSGTLNTSDASIRVQQEVAELMVPPGKAVSMTQVPNPALEASSTDMAPVAEFVKDPMPVFAELTADIVVADGTEDWNEEPPEEQGSSLNLMTYLLLSIPGIVILAGGYLLYRRLENRSRDDDLEAELIMGGDDFAALDDIDAMGVDADLALDDVRVSSEVIDTDLDSELMDANVGEEIPAPPQTEAPSAAHEDMLDTSSEAGEPDSAAEASDTDDEMFDISSIDDDLADLDLALDGDDPFADVVDDETLNEAEDSSR